VKKIIINLNDSEIKFLEEFIRKSNKSARSVARANVLLLANQIATAHPAAELA
jgi:hypothetical protein